MKRKTLYLLYSFLFIFSAGCEKELSVTPEEVLPFRNGIIIDSSPGGAKIFINGKNTGQFTPDTILWVKEYSVLITLKMELYKDSSVTINLQENDTAIVFMDYISNKTMRGRLNISSNPMGAEVSLNDSALNKTTPLILDGLLPGYYKLKFRKAGHWDDETTAIVRSVATTYIDQQLIDTTIWINYHTGRVPIPSDYLSSIVIEKGYIKWMGSLDSGLIRFDDKDWTVYNTSNSILPGNQINSVAIDDFGSLWICTNYGVVKKDGDNWILYNTQNSGLPDNKVLSVSCDGVNIAFGTMNKGLVIYDGVNWKNYTRSNSPLPSNMVTAVLYHYINLWACTDNGLAKITDTTWKIINSSNSSNIIGAGGVGGAPKSTGFPNNNLKCITVDRYGKPWVGFATDSEKPGGSAVLRIANIWRSFPKLPSADVFSIAVDMSNTKWFGNSENGLSKYEGDKWTHYNMSNSKIKSDRIFGVIVDQNGYKWMASFGAGLIKYKGS